MEKEGRQRERWRKKGRERWRKREGERDGARGGRERGERAHVMFNSGLKHYFLNITKWGCPYSCTVPTPGATSIMHKPLHKSISTSLLY